MAGFRKKAYKVEQKIFGKGGIKGRYGIGKGKGGFKFGKLAQDVEMIKSRLNVEKKEVRSDVVTTNFGQVNGNSDGAYVADLTQAINQGIGETQRIGNSLKVTGMSMPIQLTQMPDLRTSAKVRITLLRVRSADGSVTTNEAFNKVWETNPLSGVRDYNAPRAYRNSKTDGISVVRSMTCYLKSDGNDSTGEARKVTKTLRFSVKLDDIWRYTENSDTLPAGLKYYLVFQSDLGNAGSNSTRDVPVQIQNTGIELRLAQRTWFVDN